MDPRKLRPITFLCLFLLCLAARQGLARAGITEAQIDRITDAIYRIEGGAKARKPFGVLSVPCSGYDGCRRIAENTVRNNHRRWILGGAKGDFLVFLAARYCPPSADPIGHQNWIKNIRSILK